MKEADNRQIPISLLTVDHKEATSDVIFCVKGSKRWLDGHTPLADVIIFNCINILYEIEAISSVIF